MATWRLALANRGTSGLGTEVISDVMSSAGVPTGDANLRYTKYLNAPGSIEFTLPIDSGIVTQSNFAVGQRELHLYRGTTLVWTGTLYTADVSGWAVRFSGLGFWHQLKKRLVVTDLLYKDTEQLDICWNLINHTQSQPGGNLGITRYSATGSGVTRTAVYCIENKVVVGDAIEQFASADNGFDFEITPNKQFRTYYPRRSETTSVALNTATNIKDFSLLIDATDVISEARATVDAKTCDLPTVITASDSTALSQYGLLQVPVDQSSEDSGLLQGLVNEEVRINSVPRFQSRVLLDNLNPLVPAATDLAIGDRITLTASRGFVSVSNKPVRIVGMNVSLGKNGRELTELELDGVV